MFHSHGDDVDEWGGKVAPTLFINLEYAAGLATQNRQANLDTLKARASKYEELFKNN